MPVGELLQFDSVLGAVDSATKILRERADGDSLAGPHRNRLGTPRHPVLRSRSAPPTRPQARPFSVSRSPPHLPPPCRSPLPTPPQHCPLPPPASPPHLDL